MSAEGAGTQQAETALRSGNWVVVVMNADATPQVAADLTAGARSALVGPIAAGLIAGTIVLLGAAVALLVWGLPGSAGRLRRPGTMPSPYPDTQMGWPSPSAPIPSNSRVN